MAPASPRWCVVPVLAAAVLLAAAEARGEAPGGPSAATDPSAAVVPVGGPPMPTRRSGFTFGLDLGIGVSSLVGYPNDLNKIGHSTYYTVTGARPSATFEAWAGGALVDWFTVALGVKASTLLATDPDKARSFGGVFHIEAFPLFPLGGHLRDLGIRFDAGLGTATVEDASGTKLVDGAAASIVGGGVFYEGIRAWKTAHGPFIMGDYFWSDTVRRPAIFIGWRSVIYAGRVKP